MGIYLYVCGAKVLLNQEGSEAVLMHRMRAFFVPESEAAYIAVRQPRGMVVMAVPVLLV